MIALSIEHILPEGYFCRVVGTKRYPGLASGLYVKSFETGYWYLISIRWGQFYRESRNPYINRLNYLLDLELANVKNNN